TGDDITIARTPAGVRAPQGRDPVLSHPDYDRRLRNRTESADPSDPGRRSRASGKSVSSKSGSHFCGSETRQLQLSPVTAGGDFHPALRTFRFRGTSSQSADRQSRTGRPADQAGKKKRTARKIEQS